MNVVKKASLLATAALIGAASFPLPLLAQVAEPAQTPDAAPATAAPPNTEAANGAPQQVSPDNVAPGDVEQGADIVVTGTLLRGIAPTGTNVVDLTAADIAQTGATNANQVLARVPQISSAFGQVPSLSGLDGGTSIVRPNLRNLGAGGGSTTLVLVDGHRQVDAGILITSPDPDVIPPQVLERVDVVPDGGSSIYGSDAVGGVINFITKRRFDGFQANVRGGVADKYNTFDTNLTAGKDWESGSAYLSFNYARNTRLLGKDRDYARQVSPQTGTCNPGTVFVTVDGTTTSYGLPGRAAGTVAQCDSTDFVSVIPSVERTSLFGSVYQELGAGISLDVKGFYTRRVTLSANDQNRQGQSVQITSANPYYVPIGDNDPGVQTVNFSYAGVVSPDIDNQLDEWGVTPTLTADLDSNWQLRLLGNFQRSTVRQNQAQVDSVIQANAVAGTTLATAFNPYDPGATNASVFNSIVGTERTRGQQDLINGRAVVDGALFALPGGDVRLAAGGEYIRQTLQNSIVGTFSGATDVGRNVYSVFGEVAVPIFGSGNASPGLESLVLSASGRFDHYSDFGDTFNPKFGATYKPVTWITVRGNWGKSFNAPSLADKNGAPDTRAILIPNSPWTDPNDPASSASRSTILLAGGNGNLRPQKAETWSLGADVRPEFLEGLSLSATYYNIKLRDQIGIIPIFTGNTFVSSYAAYVFKNPTLAQALALVGNLPVVGGTSVASLYGTSTGDPYVVLDARRQNLGLLHQDGIDFNASYQQKTGFGSVNASVGGTYTLNRKLAGAADQPFISTLDTPGENRFSLLSTVGFNAGGLTGSLTWTHRAGYDLSPAIGTQNHVEGFDPVDLFLGYDVNGEGLLRDVSFTLTLTNMFDEDPSFYANDPGYTNGSTVGRLIQFGISKKF